MQYRPLGSTGLRVSALSFGAGPVSGLMTSNDVERQAAVVKRALEAGINWFDTAATYGQGRSEQSLGAALKRVDGTDRVHIATKVRLMPDELDDIGARVRESVTQSLSRLQIARFTLLQLHNSLTAACGDEPTSLTPRDVLGPGGVLDAFEKLRAEGVVEHFGLTGIGQPAALREVIASGAFATLQIPYHVLNPSAGQSMPAGFNETDFGNLIAECGARNMGVFAIRVFAAGALIGNAPSAHTRKTPFFPLELYERDVAKAARLRAALGTETDMRELAIRFALSHPAVSSALVGFGEPAHVDDAIAAMKRGPLPAEVLKAIEQQRAAFDAR